MSHMKDLAIKTMNREKVLKPYCIISVNEWEMYWSGAWETLAEAESAFEMKPKGPDGDGYGVDHYLCHILKETTT